MAATLLEYLTSPNPDIDCSRSTRGVNSYNERWAPVTGVEDWPDFNYDTLMKTYGSILQMSIDTVAETHPPLSTLERQVTTERSFETLLHRSIVPEINLALRIAWPFCYPNNDVQDIVEIATGDKGSKGSTEKDERYYPDWAGIRPSQLTDLGHCINLCPGETKLSSKWRSTNKDDTPGYYLPLKQIQTYCGRVWSSRYGYIVTPEELVVIRVSEETVDPGLASSRNVRDVPQQATDQAPCPRSCSVETFSSELKSNSQDTGSSFDDEANTDIEFKRLPYKSIPWGAIGNRLTVKLALWWLHMMTGNDIMIRKDYPPLQNMGVQDRVLSSTEASEKRSS